VKPVYDKWGIRVFEGDCLKVMRSMESESIHAVVTDPPYGLTELPTAKVVKALTEWVSGNREYVPLGGKGFMSKSWDRFVPPPAAWDECYRIMKPGAYMLVFAGTRTADLMGISIRLAGFEIRDEIDSIGSRISWIHGQGFAKSRNVAKDIDRMAGLEPTVIGEGRRSQNRSEGWDRPWMRDQMAELGGAGMAAFAITAPVSEAAKQWAGFGTAMKPSHEPIIVAQKPIKGPIAANVLKHGAGALNIAGCRVGNDISRGDRYRGKPPAGKSIHYSAAENSRGEPWDVPAGRWPPNVIFSHSPLLDPDTGEVVGDACAEGCVPGCAVAELDRQSGTLTSGLYKPEHADNGKLTGTYGAMTGRERNTATYGDSGGASRFFHCLRWEDTPFIWTPKAPTRERPRVAGESHSTVKPVSLLRLLCKLVTPPGGIILDCFAGTGTTGQAARAEGFPCILIDDDPQAAEWIRARLDALPKTETPVAEQVPVEPDLNLFDLLGDVS
jgi:hypothetical protein